MSKPGSCRYVKTCYNYKLIRLEKRQTSKFFTIDLFLNQIIFLVQIRYQTQIRKEMVRNLYNSHHKAQRKCWAFL